ncbi:MAG TPA: glycosyltransferase family 2 protein [Patescibacteria group bacterium]|nr:glycosyltransferase family 2 protein [Patescibacteria group bacterium]
MNITIVIPNFNGKELLSKNLPFVLDAKNNKKNNIKEIIISDDASTDDSIEFLEKNYEKKVRIISHEKNGGFAANVNDAVTKAKRELVCLLNSDVVVGKNFLETIQKDFEDNQVFAVSLHEKGFGYAKGIFKDGFIIHEGQSERNGVFESFWASGGSAVFRKDVWDELNGFDSELFPFYFEDLDLSYRAQKRGYKILWDSKTNVIHKHESTYKLLDQNYVKRMRERNYLLFNWKNITSNNLSRKHFTALVKKIFMHPGYLRIVFMAMAKRKELHKSRSIELKNSKVSDEAIFAKWN